HGGQHPIHVKRSDGEQRGGGHLEHRERQQCKLQWHYLYLWDGAGVQQSRNVPDDGRDERHDQHSVQQHRDGERQRRNTEFARWRELWEQLRRHVHGGGRNPCVFQWDVRAERTDQWGRDGKFQRGDDGFWIGDRDDIVGDDEFQCGNDHEYGGGELHDVVDVDGRELD